MAPKVKRASSATLKAFNFFHAFLTNLPALVKWFSDCGNRIREKQLKGNFKMNFLVVIGLPAPVTNLRSSAKWFY
jgi:hypothetical protein